MVYESEGSLFSAFLPIFIVHLEITANSFLFPLRLFYLKRLPMVTMLTYWMRLHIKLTAILKRTKCFDIKDNLVALS